MRVLIVGPGYVGLRLGEELAEHGHEVFGLRRSAAGAEAMRAAGIKPLIGDITQTASLAELPSGFDWVVNCVSSTQGGAEEYRRVYLQGTRNLIGWLSGSLPAKFVYTSSTSVYGQNDGSLVDETSPTHPTSETGRVLVETEQAILESALHGFPAVILRVAGIYGPGRGWWFKQFLAGEARIEGTGQRALNMIHRDDVAGCILAALERGATGHIYNAVDDESVTQRDFFQWLSQQTNRPMPPSVAEDLELTRKRGVTNKRISNAKLKSMLACTFRFPTFREGYAPEIARANIG